MDPRPLPALLSQTLVAFIIEFDNEAEHRMPHRTTRQGSTDAHAPWLVSMAMWENCMKPLGDEEITIRELVRRARAVTKFVGMKRWGYISIRPDPSGSKSSADKLVRATPAGRKAQEIWQPLTDVIEHRWQDRFGKREISNLRESLSAVESQLEIELPDCLPILGYGLFSKGRRYKPRTASHAPRDLHLSAALSRILLAFALEFESESDLSLAISANVLRVLNEKGVRLSEIPRVTGVSKEAISMAMGILRKQLLAAIEPDPAGGKFKLVRLTPSGRKAQNAYRKLVQEIEHRWQTRFGEDKIHNLRSSLEKLVGDGSADCSPLFGGLEPYPGSWRASIAKPQALPHYPMVLHRGGFPDGS